jgi:hypothetical protein
MITWFISHTYPMLREQDVSSHNPFLDLTQLSSGPWLGSPEPQFVKVTGQLFRQA